MISFKFVPILTLVLSLSACLKARHLPSEESSASTSGSLRRLIGSSLSLIVGQPQSIKLVEGLSAAQKATLLVTVENRELSALRGHELKPVVIPYLALKKPANYQVKHYLQGFYSESSLAEKNYPQRLINRLGSPLCAQDLVIPYHPDTTVMHPVLQELEKKGASVKKSQWEAYHSMSRSLFVVNNDDPQLPTLFSVKMGTNTVNGMRQDQKIYVYEEEVTAINDLSTKTSIPFLMDFFGIKLLQDTAGVQISPMGVKSDDPTKNYAYNFRDYSTLIRDKNYVYMPLDFFKWKAKLDQDGMLSWEIDQNIYLKISREYLVQYVHDLAFETGKFEGILLANGYTTENFHGQNVLVGIPLDPGKHARLGFRDVGDSEDFLSLLKTKNEKLPMMNEANWCVVLRQFELNRDQCFSQVVKNHGAGFQRVFEKLGFFPNETQKIWELTHGKGDVLGAQENEIRDFYTKKISAIRTIKRMTKEKSSVPQDFCMTGQRIQMHQCMSQKASF